MNKEITDDEHEAMRSVGFGEYMIDISDVSDEFYDDFIKLCKLYVKLESLQRELNRLTLPQRDKAE